MKIGVGEPAFVDRMLYGGINPSTFTPNKAEVEIFVKGVGILTVIPVLIKFLKSASEMVSISGQGVKGEVFNKAVVGFRVVPNLVSFI